MIQHLSKLSFGHGHCRLTKGITRGIPHLTSVNPYIASSLRPAKSSATADSGVLMPRQQAGSASVAPAGADVAAAGSGACVGISGFAFQGTNALVITGRSD